MSNHPYYHPDYAGDLKPVLLSMNEDGEKGKVFDCEKCNLELTTIYARIIYGWKYLRDHDDTIDWDSLRDKIDVVKVYTPRKQVKLYWKHKRKKKIFGLSAHDTDEQREMSAPTGRAPESRRRKVEWRPLLEKFIAGGEDIKPKFVLKNLNLELEEVETIRTLLRDKADITPLSLTAEQIILYRGEL